MKSLKYSKDTDILLIELSEEPIDYAVEADAFIIHFSEKDRPVLIEMQDASRMLSAIEVAVYGHGFAELVEAVYKLLQAYLTRDEELRQMYEELRRIKESVTPPVR
jgi:hypothetical protein